jgi:asparagine synthase (glutamine-hydrolysing)
MCGILGLLAPGSQPVLHSQLRLLAHRGPNDEGCYADADVFLGARRLSIIDLAGGHQPLANETETVWAVQNGEIYNYLEVRGELVARGHVFRTRSDTEVIVHAYEEWGAECPKHLRGIFAFAVWDAPRRRLLLARDRFGVKPLYYCRLPGGGLAFASEIRPLLSFLPDGPRADLFALRALFSVGFIPTPHTAFEGLHKLPAAHSLRVEEDRVRVETYWDILPHPLPPLPLGEGPGVRAYVETFKQHLTRAVAEQRMSEVPLGALISGGIDSASIAALLQAQSSERLHTFNLGFERARYDETRYAALAARHIGTQHHQIVFRQADFDRYPEVMAHLEEPQCSATALPLYLLYEACRRAGLTVILTGEGSDELLGGYHWFRGDAQARRLFWLPRLMRETLAAAPLAISEAGRAVLRRAEPDTVARYALWHNVGRVAGLLSPEVRRADGLVDHWRDSLDGAMRGLDPFRQFQYLEAHTRLADFINFEVDRMSMAHSVEARVPFLDHELWEFAASLPSQVLLDGPEPKRLLRQAMRSYLPPEILARRKWGLAAPYLDWLRRPRLPDWAEEALSDFALADAGYFNAAAVRCLRAEHQTGRRSHARLLMGVLSTQVWHAQFVARAQPGLAEGAEEISSFC